MKLRIKSMLLVMLVILSILLTAIPASAAGSTNLYNEGTRDEVCTTFDGYNAKNYYKSYDYDALSAMSESQLFSTLQTLMRSTHKYTSSYDDCHYLADHTDCEEGKGDVLLLYTSYSATMKQWNGWNREHVWPKSLGGNNTSGGGADLHHIRPSDAGVNSSRGNKPYGNVNGGTQKKGTNPAVGYLGGTYNSTYFEPLDNVKGDVARICLYVYVRWNSNWGATSITKVFQSVDVLLDWCELDPVDTWEMSRNDVVESIQGNRNVFIDYPELAWTLFGRDVPSDMTTPSGEAKNQDDDPTPPAHTHSYGTTWKSNETTHYKECSCGEKTSVAAHADSDKNGKCDTCSYTVSVPHTHSYGETWKSNETTHYKECSCGDKTSVATHADSDNNGKCDTCSYTVSIPDDPTPPAHTHSYGETWKSNETTHYKECSCGEKTSVAAHADSDKNGQCDTCSYTVSVPHTHSYGTTWKSNETTHYKECSCGEKTSVTAHADSDNNGKCDTCSYTVSVPHTHSYGTAWKSNETTHYKECSCGEKTSVATHADSDKNGKCDTCSYTVSIPDDPTPNPDPTPTPTPNPDPTPDADCVHMWSVDQVISEPTETQTGIVKHVCTKCGEARFVNTPKKVVAPASGCASSIALSQTTLSALVLVAFGIVKKKYF